jgi:PEGA domain-containing protein
VNRVLVLLVLLGGLAHADDDRKRAELLFRAGEEAYRVQNFDAAAQNFEEAYKVAPLPEIAFSAAQAYRRQYQVDGKADHVARAVELYRLYLDKVKTGGRVADAADALIDMQRELDKLIKSGAHVSPQLAAEHTQLGAYVKLGGTPAATGVHEVEDVERAPEASVTVTLDGKPVMPFALTNVAPGKHVLRAEAPGYFPRDKPAVAVQGASEMIDIALDPKPGRIAIETEAGARLEVDGRAAGSAPRAAIEVPAGHHLVTIVHRGREPIAREVTLRNDEALRVDAPLAPTAQRRAVPWVLGGAGALALTAGITGVVALVAEHDAQDIASRAHAQGNLPPSDRDAYEADRGRRDSFATAAWVTGTAALATAAIGAALYEFDEPGPASLHVLPVMSTTAGGAAVFGRF